MNNFTDNNGIQKEEKTYADLQQRILEWEGTG